MVQQESLVRRVLVRRWVVRASLQPLGRRQVQPQAREPVLAQQGLTAVQSHSLRT
jgi:hypothetical protein